MNIRYFIERGGLYHWSGGWIPVVAAAQSYETEGDARAALETLAKRHPAAFAGVTVVGKVLTIDPSTGRWVETIDGAGQTQAPLSFAVPATPDVEDDVLTVETAVHPAEAPQGLGDPDEVKRRDRKLRFSLGQERAALARFAADPAGAAWLRRLLSNAHLTHSSFSSDPYHTAFREGERNSGLYVLSEITAACDAAMVAKLLTGKTNDV